MKRRDNIFLLLLTACLVTLPVAAEDPPLAVSDVVAEQRVLDPATSGAAVHWRYHLSREAEVLASLYDARNVLVRRLHEHGDLPAGDQRLVWDGKDDLGRDVPAGYYLLTIEAHADDERVLYDPSDRTGGTLIQATNVAYDPETSRIGYALPDAALVRIHAGLNNGLLLRTPVDWVARSAGRHTEFWDGMDESRVLEFGSSDQIDIQIWAYKLPVNAVVVADASSQDGPQLLLASDSRSRHGEVSPSLRSVYLEFEEDRERREAEPPRKLEMYNHWRQDRATARDPKIFLSVPAGWPRHGDAILVDRPVGIRLNVVEEDEAFLQAERFETVVYLDGSFVFEEEQGYAPYTWRLKPELLPPGEHIVTYMIRGYEGHFGSGSIKVYRPDPRVAENDAQPAGEPGLEAAD